MFFLRESDDDPDTSPSVDLFFGEQLPSESSLTLISLRLLATKPPSQ